MDSHLVNYLGESTVPRMRREIRLEPPAPAFRGSDAVLAGTLTRSQLRGPKVQRLFQGVYALAREPMTHELRCAGAALVLPPER